MAQVISENSTSVLAKDAGIGPIFAERRSHPHNPAAAAPHDRRVGEARQRVKNLREKASAEIDRLIAFLDASDGYTMDEREEAVDDVPCDDDELEETGDEHEPSLASFERHPSVCGPDSFRSSIGDQTNWTEGNTDDREEDAAESGITDLDGLLEQVESQDWQHTVMG
jgi:hypothetical protein